MNRGRANILGHEIDNRGICGMLRAVRREPAFPLAPRRLLDRAREAGLIDYDETSWTWSLTARGEQYLRTAQYWN